MQRRAEVIPQTLSKAEKLLFICIGLDVLFKVSPSIESRTTRFVLALAHLGPGPAAVTCGGVRVGEGDDLGD